MLVELKLYEESIVGLIREFLGRHDARLSDAEIIEALENGEFLLLIDGVNELPSEAARRDLESFRNRYQKSTPMIFTTRDLGLSGNLGIEKKLEMLPLSETQMREFVCAYLPETGEAMLGKLKERLREFGQTPLLLKMLCDLYAQAKEIPENLGLIFRAFTAQYENHPELKGKVPLGVSSKSFWGDLLQEIAFRMMQGNDDPKEIAVAISKSEAEKVIWEFCKDANLPNSLGNARKWLQELLVHHLIELEGRNQIAFRHQLLQEYYAAEKLLSLLPDLDNASLKWNYLNYLEWTEALKLMCSLIDNPIQGERVLDLCLSLDLSLAATMLGCLSDKYQEQHIHKFLELNIDYKFKLDLINLSKSKYFTEYLIEKIYSQQGEFDFFGFELYIIGRINSDYLILKSLLVDLLDLIKCDHSFREDTGFGFALGRLLGKLASQDKEIFSMIEREISIRESSEAQRDMQHSIFPELIHQGNQQTQDFWLRLLQGKSIEVKQNCILSISLLHFDKLHKLDDLFLKKIAREIRDSFPLISTRHQSESIQILGEIDLHNSEDIIVEAISSREKSLRRSAVWTLGRAKKTKYIPYIEKVLNDQDIDVSIAASEVLIKADNQKGTERLLSLLNSSKVWERAKAASALSIAKSEEVVCSLKKALTDPFFEVRWRAAASLRKIDPNSSIQELINSLYDSYPQVRQYAAYALGSISKPPDRVISELCKVSEDDSDARVRGYAINALVEIASDEVPEILLGRLGNNQNTASIINGLATLKVEKAKEELVEIIANSNIKNAQVASRSLLQLSPDNNSFFTLLNRTEKESYEFSLINIVKGYQKSLKIHRPKPIHLGENTDFLIIAALPDEFYIFQNCLSQNWLKGSDQQNFPYQQTKFNDYFLTLARPVNMGEVHASNLATRLIDELKPKAIFMTGICAGNSDKVKLGDVIVASNIFKADTGKQTSEGFFHDVKTYNLKPNWLHRLQALIQDPNWHQDIQTPRPKTFTHQKGWFLHTLHDHEAKPDLCPSPADHPDRQIHCPDWQDTVEQLVADELITLSELHLTSKAIDLIRENRILHLDTGFAHDPAYPKVHIGAMATTSSVQEDPELFHRIKKYAGQRNILGVEMEGAALGAVGEIHDIPVLVIKAVQDYGDETKSDQFREYAAEASARFLLKFLETLNPEDL